MLRHRRSRTPPRRPRRGLRPQQQHPRPADLDVTTEAPGSQTGPGDGGSGTSDSPGDSSGDSGGSAPRTPAPTWPVPRSRPAPAARRCRSPAPRPPPLAPGRPDPPPPPRVARSGRGSRRVASFGRGLPSSGALRSRAPVEWRVTGRGLPSSGELWLALIAANPAGSRHSTAAPARNPPLNYSTDQNPPLNVRGGGAAGQPHVSRRPIAGRLVWRVVAGFSAANPARTRHPTADPSRNPPPDR